jgi:CrcB protein
MPVGTLAANLLGCLVLGIVLGSLRPGSLVFLFLVAGFCGALTTFSTFTFELIDARPTWAAIGYGVLSVAGGVGTLLLGLRMGRWLG